MLNLKEKWALVTGASRGIGRLTALCLAKQGVNLILHSRDISHTETLLTEVKSLGVEAYAVSANLANTAEIASMLGEIDRHKTPVSILLNNAGVQVAYRIEYCKTPAEDYETSFQVNTIAPMLLCYHFLPGMEERGFGRIVNITSGIRLEPEQAGYSASKAALDKVTIDLGSTVDGTDVMINLADPGWCRTDLGGPHAPNDPTFAIPGVVLGVFVNDKKSGRLFAASDFAGLSLEDAVIKAEKTIPSPYTA